MVCKTGSIIRSRYFCIHMERNAILSASKMPEQSVPIELALYQPSIVEIISQNNIFDIYPLCCYVP